MEQIRAADVAAGLRELADILETGELGELGDVEALLSASSSEAQS